jgi:hypothetical protein
LLGSWCSVDAAPYEPLLVGVVCGCLALRQDGTGSALFGGPLPVGAVFADPAVAASALAGCGSAGFGGVREGEDQGFPAGYGGSSRLVMARYEGQVSSWWMVMR